MRQMVERGFGYWEPEYIVAENNGEICDPFRTSNPLYKDYKGFIEDYKNHNIALKNALLKCDVFILTLGLTEAWFFAHSEKYTSVSPHKIEPSLLRQKNLSVEDNIKELEKYMLFTKNTNQISNLLYLFHQYHLIKLFLKRTMLYLQHVYQNLFLELQPTNL